MTRVLIAQSNRLIAEAIALALRSAGFDPLAEGTHTPEAIRKSARRWQPDITVLGVELRRGVPDGLRLISTLKGLGSKVIVFADPAALTLRAACLEAGADGLAAETDGLNTVLATIERAARGKPLLSENERHEILCQATSRLRRSQEAREPFDRLSSREKQVLLALMHGKAAAQIAGETYVSLATVRSHIRTLLMKLAVSSQLAAVAAALEAGWPDSRGRTAPEVHVAGPKLDVSAHSPALFEPLDQLELGVGS